MWEVEFTDEFGRWWNELSEVEQDAVAASVRLLEELGLGLPKPHADTLKGSRHPNMKELRTQCQGRPLRTLLPLTDRLYDEHLEQLAEQGLI